MKYFSVALITVAVLAGDFLSHWADLAPKEQKGWSWSSSLCLIYAGWFFWRGRDGHDT